MAFSFDGTALNSSGSGTTIAQALTTTAGGEVIFAIVATYAISSVAAPTVTGMSGGGLSWTKRFSSGSTAVFGTTQHINIDVWYAVAASPLSAQTITATLSGSPNNGSELLVFGLAGANTSSIFDTNGSLPAKAAGTASGARPQVTGVSTSNANDLIIGVCAMNVSAAVNHPGAGYTDLSNDGGFFDSQYQIVSATQSSITVAFGASENGASSGFLMYADAIQAAVAAARYKRLNVHLRR